MIQIERISRLLAETDTEILWVGKAKEIFRAIDLRAVYENPGRMSVRDVLANSRVHAKTLAAAQRTAIGLKELIHALEHMNLHDKLLCFGFASDSLSFIGNCYVAKDEKLIGCVWVSVT